MDNTQIKILEDRLNNPDLPSSVKESIKEKIKVLKGNKTVTK
jgi:hypothetical protein